ncbi:MAG: hypothetical protein CBB97_07600 [Candidatus Endolissoclinum sp. TMED37]|nr:MAG: hypothetical protein CBB97_07600 [Candidatus Endolissoclinum sp. TMED37]|tara:strand:+ start:1119 stop:1922 length:804 start_codon:yes stop_codon:yes gene_type:complete
MEISAIILSKNEECNILKCIQSLLIHGIKDIHLLDSMSNDNTVKIAKVFGAKIYYRKFDNYLNQLCFAIDNCKFKHSLVIRIDADEELLKLNKLEIISLKNINNKKVKKIKVVAGSGIRKYSFLGKILNFMPVSNKNTVRIIDRLHYKTNGQFIDESFEADIVLNDLFQILDKCEKGFFHFLKKHINYGIKHGYELSHNRNNLLKNPNYKIYLKLPPFIRPLCLFFYYLIIKKGYKDGFNGIVYLLVQTLLMRLIADIYYYKYKRYK